MKTTNYNNCTINHISYNYNNVIIQQIPPKPARKSFFRKLWDFLGNVWKNI